MKNNLETYQDLLNELQKLTPEQLIMPIMAVNSVNETPFQAIHIDTAKNLELAKQDEQLIILLDWWPD